MENKKEIINKTLSMTMIPRQIDIGSYSQALLVFAYGSAAFVFFTGCASCPSLAFINVAMLPHSSIAV